MLSWTILNLQLLRRWIHGVAIFAILQQYNQPPFCMFPYDAIIL